MENNQYWQNLDELHQTPQYREEAEKEFQEELPVMDYMEDASTHSGTGRRDFLKMLGFSVSAAALATSCKIPVKKAMTYAFDGTDQIPHIVPGLAKYFASTFVDGTNFSNVLVKTREGRPIKIESNEMLPGRKGTSARAQASVLNLYDSTRAKGPTKGGEEITWEQVDTEIGAKLDQIASAGGRIVVLMESSASLAGKAALQAFKTKYPAAEVVAYDPVSYSAIRKANQISLGQPIIPSYAFDKADVIVGSNCDFLGTWGNPVEYANQYAVNRVPDKENPKMSKHIQIQSIQTITGSSADDRVVIKPSEEKGLLIAIYNIVANRKGAPSLAGPSTEHAEHAQKVAGALLGAEGRSIVVSGTNDLDIQLTINAINSLLGNYGNTIDTARPNNLAAGNDEDLAGLAASLNGVAALILWNANPVYNTPFRAEFEAALPTLDLSVSISDRIDESAAHVQYHCPDNHFLESWDILEATAGHYCMIQPVIRNIYDTRQGAESIAKWSGDNRTSYDIVKGVALDGLVSGEAGWQNSLKTGHAAGAAGTPLTVDLAATLGGVTARGNTGEGLEVVFYESVAIGSGRMANNPLLQELPDPVSKVTWENYLSIPYEMAEAEGIEYWFNYKKVPTADLTLNGKTVTLPVVVTFGQAPGTLAVALGYGRSHAGRAAEGAGQDVYPMLSTEGGLVRYTASGATVTFNKGAQYPLGIQQMYGTLMEDNALPGKEPQYRIGIVKETILDEYKKNPYAGNEDRKKVMHHLQTLYGYHEYQGHHWGMAVDLNSCIGCGACVVSCNVENNIPVVGKKEVFMSRSMHWMRIDRYFSGDKNNPEVSFQPMMCQHCDNAPCENVCPVNATQHSSEGLNQMIYNRCIGTRYCANNCPYKVRRFNWYDYQANDLFSSANDPKATDYMFDDLTRMVLNPDVTVRTRGVIEKCTFCAQKIQEGKLTAKSEGRKLKDGEIKTACQTACPTNAIKFGDLNDEESEVHDYFFKNSRNYHVLEEQHFLPSVGYQVKIRNKEEGPAKNFS